MSIPIFADVSNYQKSIDWPAYKKYAASFDGIARVAIKSSEGEGFTDPSFAAHRAGALAAGVDEIWYYHFGRPGLGNAAIDEAESQRRIVGAIRDQDVMCLDMEETMPQANAAWALAWLAQQQHNYGKPPLLYSYLSYIQTRLQDPRLAAYPLWLAQWTYDPAARPACPKPWVSYAAIQYTDRATNVPGISTAVDASVYLLAPTTPSGGVPVSELANFPFVNQRTDGDINHDFDCVPSSLEAGANYLLGKKVIDDATMKDAIYGKSYVGGTAATAYVDYLKARGVHLYPINGAGSDLLKQARTHLGLGHPVVFTRDDPYSSNPNFSHVSVWYKDTSTTLSAMDPFGAHDVTMSDAAWMTHLRGNQLWIMEKIMQQYSEQSADFGSYFTAVDASHWKCKTTGKVVQFGIKGFYSSLSLDGNTLPLIGLPVSGEINLTFSGKPVVLQVFERAGVYYDPSHIKDKQPGTGDCSLCHLNDTDLLKNVPGMPTTAPVPTPVPTSMPNVFDAVSQIEAATAAAGVITASLSKALTDLKQ